MTDVISYVSNALTICKQLLELSEAHKDATSKLLIAELNVQLAGVKMQLAELMTENAELRQELLKKAEPALKLTVRDGMYFKEDGDGPFCTACYDTKKQLVRVPETADAMHMICRWRCNVCKAHYA